MDFDEALTFLGVARDADADAVRRAYLRLVKVHKPDRDPEGFKRVREAYDVARAVVRWRPASPSGASPTPVSVSEDGSDRPLEPSSSEPPQLNVATGSEPPPFESIPLASSDTESRGLPSAEGEPQRAEAAPSAGPDEWQEGDDEAWAERCAQRLREASDDDYARVLDEVLGEPRASDGAQQICWWLLDDVSGERMAAFLREAERRHCDGFDHAVVTWLPGSASESEIRAAQEDDAVEPSVLLQALRSRGDWLAASRVLLAMLSDPHEELEGYSLLTLALELDANGYHDAARRVVKALNERIGDAASERELFGDMAATWHLVRQYFRARPHMIDDAKALVAFSLAELDWESTRQRAARWMHEHPEGAQRAALGARRALSRHGPELAGFVFETETAVEEPKFKKASPPIPWFAVAIITLTLFRVCAHYGRNVAPAIEDSRDQAVKTLPAEERSLPAPFDETEPSPTPPQETP